MTATTAQPSADAATPSRGLDQPEPEPTVTHGPDAVGDEEIGRVPIRVVPLGWLVPSPENDKLYRPADPADPDIAHMAEGMGVEGQLEPSVATTDGYLVSGHRRRVAAELAGLTAVPCRVLAFRRADDPERFLRLLRRFNEQRVKTRDERLREAVLDANPEEEYRALIDHRRLQLRPPVANVTLGTKRKRAKISVAKRPFLDAILRVLDGVRDFWPVSERSIHYQLLNAPPLRHASKPGSEYTNTRKASKDLSDLCTRARVTGEIPMDAISDETRPISVWRTDNEAGTYVAGEIDGFLKGYNRNLIQSQPDHIEIVCEKLTLKNLVDEVAGKYGIPTTIGRGFGSVPPRRDMNDRYASSGKARLVVLLVTDFDPDGEAIAETFARSMRDDFGIADVVPIKVTLTAEQVKSYELPPKLKAKATSSRSKGFVERHGDDVWELEALPLPELQKLLRGAIDGVLDVAAFNAEVDAERQDAAFLAGVRRTVAQLLAGVDFSQGGRQ